MPQIAFSTRHEFFMRASTVCAGALLPVLRPGRHQYNRYRSNRYWPNRYRSNSRPIEENHPQPGILPVQAERLGQAPTDHPSRIKVKIFCVGEPGLHAFSQIKREFGFIDPCLDYIHIDTRGTKGEGSFLPESTKQFLINLLNDTDMVLIITEPGQALSAGLAPHIADLIAKLGRERKKLTVTFAVPPPPEPRICRIEREWKPLLQAGDALIRMPASASGAESFLPHAVFALCNALYSEGYVCIDVADVKDILTNAGELRFGMGEAAGKDRVATATGRALGLILENVRPAAVTGSVLAVMTTHDEEVVTSDELEVFSDMVMAAFNITDYNYSINFLWTHRVHHRIRPGRVHVAVYAG